MEAINVNCLDILHSTGDVNLKDPLLVSRLLIHLA